MMIEKRSSHFVWDAKKESANIQKHGVDFRAAARAFKDPQRKIFTDSQHSQKEQRYFCIGKVGRKVLTVRFMRREGMIRIIGAGYWRKGARYYGQKKEE